MERRTLGPNDVSQARSLWKDAFPSDGASFLDWFFETQYPALASWSYWEGGKLITAVYAMPYELRLRGKAFDAPLILGVATHSSARKRGLMRSLLDDVHADIAQTNPACCLYPFHFGFYRHLGYAAVSERIRCRIPAAALIGASEAHAIEAPDRSDFAGVSHRMSERFGFSALRSEALIARRFGETIAEGGLALSNDGAYAFVYPPDADPKATVLSEFAYDSLSAARDLLAAIARRFPDSTLDFGMPTEDAPHDWIDDDRGMLALEPYLMLAVLDWQGLLQGMRADRDADVAIAIDGRALRIQTRGGLVGSVSPTDAPPDVSLTRGQATRWICGRSDAERLALEGVGHASMLDFFPAQRAYFFDMY